MKILVLGAGLIGTATAWYLQKAGHEVTVVDRQKGPGLETSFANGSQISVSHAEPWANPGAPLQILRWLLRPDAPLLFRLRADPAQWRWGLAFLRECLPARTASNIAQIVQLGLYSRACLQELRRDIGLSYEQLEKGILYFYTHQEDFEAAREPARIMREHGCDIRLLNAGQAVAIEPALAHMRDRIAGASYSPDDESGDAYQFTAQLAARAAAAGVDFRYGRHIGAVLPGGDTVEGVRMSEEGGAGETLKADAYVAALGSYSPLLLRPLGLNLLVYPAKGYSVTCPVADPARANSVSLTDDRYKLVFSRLGNRLRAAGTAELAGYDTGLNEVRCHAILKRTLYLFPGAIDPSRAQFWAGLRPATPSNVPYIGRTRYRNLFLNTGHGTLGWTHACGSGKALADIVSGRMPEVDFSFCS
jgi:D-amino-acid dehydrogenase